MWLRGRGAGAAAQHELVAHELAVVLAERAGRRRGSRGRARRRSRVHSQTSPNSCGERRRRGAAGAGCRRPLSTKLPSNGDARVAAHLPLGLGRQPRAGPAREGVGLVEAHVADGLGRARADGGPPSVNSRIAPSRAPSRAAPASRALAPRPSRRRATARAAGSRRRSMKARYSRVGDQRARRARSGRGRRGGAGTRCRRRSRAPAWPISTQPGARSACRTRAAPARPPAAVSRSAIERAQRVAARAACFTSVRISSWCCCSWWSPSSTIAAQLGVGGRARLRAALARARRRGAR